MLTGSDTGGFLIIHTAADSHCQHEDHVGNNRQLFRASSRSSLSLNGRTMPVPVDTGEKPYI